MTGISVRIRGRALASPITSLASSMRRLLLLCLPVAALVAAGCGGDDTSTTATTGTGATAAPPTATQTTPAEPDPTLAQKPTIEVPDKPAPKKLVTRDLVEGTGAEAKPGDTVTVDYVGVLYKNGKQFDASWDRGQPFSFPLGAGQVIPGWDEGVAGMKVGGRRELVIPPAMAYGSEGAPPDIPPNAPLIFVVDLKEISG
jgi:peptidylprolyl isomerase